MHMEGEDPEVAVFEECVGMTLKDCKKHIVDHVGLHAADFSEGISEFEVLPVRASGTASYYLVGLRTDVTETNVVGVLGDGMVFYPFEWCTTDGCVEAGPWDCDVGTPLTVDDCCAMIKNDAAFKDKPDVNGNEIGCFPDFPIGSPSKPRNLKRVCIHVDTNDIVVHPPRNE